MPHISYHDIVVRRSQEVLDYVKACDDGATIPEITDALDYSEQTIRNHMASLADANLVEATNLIRRKDGAKRGAVVYRAFGQRKQPRVETTGAGLQPLLAVLGLKEEPLEVAPSAPVAAATEFTRALGNFAYWGTLDPNNPDELRLFREESKEQRRRLVEALSHAERLVRNLRSLLNNDDLWELTSLRACITEDTAAPAPKNLQQNALTYVMLQGRLLKALMDTRAQR